MSSLYCAVPLRSVLNPFSGGGRTQGTDNGPGPRLCPVPHRDTCQLLIPVLQVVSIFSYPSSQIPSLEILWSGAFPCVSRLLSPSQPKLAASLWSSHLCLSSHLLFYVQWMSSWKVREVVVIVSLSVFDPVSVCFCASLSVFIHAYIDLSPCLFISIHFSVSLFCSSLFV